MKKFKIGGQFSGVGAFDQALIRLGINYENVYQADWDKYARQTYLHNYEEPEYYVKDVYDTPVQEITEKHGSLDIMMFSPPCQAFSLAGKRKGEEDKRGILFYNSHEFIQVNKPKYFIFENVKGLLSDDGGNTFAKWVQYLGGKSVNGVPTLFPHHEAVPYHIYWRVLNAKDYNIPQNRERVFIIGIRDDENNNFTWPKELFLERRLRDVLETDVDEKYYLSEKLVSWITMHRDKRDSRNNFPMDEDDVSQCVTARYYKTGAEDPYIKVKSATKQGYELAEIGEDSINFEHPDSKTRRGRVGVGVGQTLTTSCNQGVATVDVVANLPGKHEQNSRVYGTDGLSPTLTTMQGGGQEPKIKTGFRIRKLTPRECFRLMDFPDTFSWPVSDTQAYKQAGNSICVGVLAGIISRLSLVIKDERKAS